MTAHFKSKEACPKCRSNGRDKSGDNLAIYPDGHKWCFACGYREFNHKHASLIVNPAAEGPRQVHMPNDADTTIDGRALTWLTKYDIEWKELSKYHILWSKSREYLIFPFYGEHNNLLFWQAKTFKENSKKYLTFGSPEKVVPFDWTGNLNRGIIVVEDIISGIKLQRQYNAFPLFGSYLSDSRLTMLKYQTDRLLIWLDYDKRSNAVTIAAKAQSMGFSASLMITEQDPKCYTNKEIKEMVDEHNNGDVPF